MRIPATQLPRVVACNGSHSMEASPASIELPTTDRDEGIAAHHVAAATLNGSISDPLDMVDRQTPNGIFVTADMAEHVGKFTDMIARRGYTDEAIIGVESEVDFEVPTTNIVITCRPDHYAFDTGSGVLHIDDFKYGWRIVEPFNHWTLIAYAIGVMHRHNWQPTMVVFTICQPRPLHRDGPIREWSISGQELTALFVALCSVLANLQDVLNSGPHCRKCKALAICPAAREAGYNAIEASTVKFTDQIVGENLASEIRTLRRASDAINLKLDAYEELATHLIQQNGPGFVPGFTVEQQFGNRAFTGGLTPEIISIMTGKPIDQITTRKTITPAALERLGVPENVVQSLTYRPPTKRKLVEFDASKAGTKLFGKG